MPLSAANTFTAAVLHTCPPTQVCEDDGVDPSGPRKVVSFAGPAVTLPLVLTFAGRGGQVILSERAWHGVKPVLNQHPSAVTVISLGSHVVCDDFPLPMLLMEVMPNLLAKRVFNPVLTKRLVEPGYRDAPDPKDPMTIVFVKVWPAAHWAAAHARLCADARASADCVPATAATAAHDCCAHAAALHNRRCTHRCPSRPRWWRPRRATPAAARCVTRTSPPPSRRSR